MVERDEQHSRNNRFAELCTGVVDAFSRYGSASGGTVMLLHVRRCHAFGSQSDTSQIAVIRAISELCMRRRANAAETGEPRPLLLCVVSQEEALGDEVLRRRATDCNAIVDAVDLSCEHVNEYLEHLMKLSDTAQHTSSMMCSSTSIFSIGSFAHPSQKQIVDCTSPNQAQRRVLAQHLHEMAGGNPKTIQALFSVLEASQALRRLSDGSLEVNPGSERLFKGSFKLPEHLKGEAFCFFERLDPMEQMVLKALSACEGNIGEVHEIARCLHSIKQSDIVEICERLAEPGTRALERVAPEDVPCERAAARAATASEAVWYRFYSDLLRSIVSTLVLSVLRTEVRRNTATNFDEESLMKLSEGTNRLSFTLPGMATSESQT
jgi:hypothetical protein